MFAALFTSKIVDITHKPVHVCKDFGYSVVPPNSEYGIELHNCSPTQRMVFEIFVRDVKLFDGHLILEPNQTLVLTKNSIPQQGSILTMILPHTFLVIEARLERTPNPERQIPPTINVVDEVPFELKFRCVTILPLKLTTTCCEDIEPPPTPKSQLLKKAAKKLLTKIVERYVTKK